MEVLETGGSPGDSARPRPPQPEGLPSPLRVTIGDSSGMAALQNETASSASAKTINISVALNKEIAHFLTQEHKDRMELHDLR